MIKSLISKNIVPRLNSELGQRADELTRNTWVPAVASTQKSLIVSVVSMNTDMNTQTNIKIKTATPRKKWSNLSAISAALSIATLLIGSSVLSGCQSIPTAQIQPVVAQPNIPLSAGEGYEVYGQQQVPSSLAAVRWQTFYSDPKLRALIGLGLENNKNIEQTILAIRKAAAQYRISDSQDLPTVNASGGYTRQATNAVDKNPRDSYNVNLGLANYELDFWGKIASLKDQALQSYLASNAASDTAKVSLIANIAKSYVNLSYQLKQLELATKTLQSREESLRITTARLNAGIDSKAPSLQAAASVETARIAALNAQSAVLKAKNALKYLVGVPITDDLLPSPAVTAITKEEVLSAGLPSELLLYRPDVLQAEYRLKAAGANIEVARSAFYPSISLTGRLGYSSSDLSDLFKTSAAGWSFGPSISVPIFDAGQRQANYEVAQIEREQALANYEQSIETAFKEVGDVLADRATLDDRTKSQYRLQQNYNEIFEISEARYIAQVDDYLSVLDAQRSLFSTQQSILNLEQARLNNQIDLYEVLGGGANLIEPMPIPTTQHTNLVGLLNPQSEAEKVDAAIKAASRPIVISNVQPQPSATVASAPAPTLNAANADEISPVTADVNGIATEQSDTDTINAEMLNEKTANEQNAIEGTEVTDVIDEAIANQEQREAFEERLLDEDVLNESNTDDLSLSSELTTPSQTDLELPQEDVTVDEATVDGIDMNETMDKKMNEE